jgi:hypothetical protein
MPLHCAPEFNKSEKTFPDAETIMEPAKQRKLEFITTAGRRVTTRMSDMSEHREQWQMVIFLILTFGALYTGILIIGEKNPLGEQVHSAINSGIPLMIYSGFVLILGLIMSWRRMSEQTTIKIIKFDHTGITLGNKKIGGGATITVPWWDVEALEIVDETGGEAVLYMATRSLKIYKIKWQNAFAWVEPETFFIELKTNAPNAMVNFAQRDIAIGAQDTRYTNLWLQYFSSPDTRQRRGALSTGTVLNEGRYRVLKRLGGGGQATVYLSSAKVSDLSLGSPSSEDDEIFVVLKEYVLPVHRGSALADKQYEILNGEAQMLGYINHPSIVKMLDCFVEDHRAYLVLDYVDGDSLKTLVEKNGPLEEALVREVALTICDILSYLHGRRPPIIHRDLTPDNLLCDSEGRIYLIDFTVAHQFQSTRTATVVGKQAYIPAEQFRGAPSPQSDLYALGCTMYFLLTGNDPEPMQQSHPQEALSTVSSAMDAIVARATEFDAADRYDSAEQVRDDLERLSAG